MSEWTPQKTIIRGLAATCISECDLVAWVHRTAAQVDDPEIFADHSDGELYQAIVELSETGVIYYQHRVTCRTCDESADGVALVDPDLRIREVTS